MAAVTPPDPNTSGRTGLPTPSTTPASRSRGQQKKNDDPQVRLTKAKGFLRDQNADRSTNWERDLAALRKYVDDLVLAYNGEAWGDDLREVVGMLKTMEVHEDYKRKNRKLVLDFTESPFAAKSHRLPFMPGQTPKLVANPEPPQRAHPVDEDEDDYVPRIPTQKPDIFFEPESLVDPPEEVNSLDPFTYTKGNIWLQKGQRKRAQDTREAAEQQAENATMVNKLRYDKSLITPSLPPLANWMGPVSKLCLDSAKKQVYDDLKKYQSLVRRLRSKTPCTQLYDDARPVLSQTLACIDAGIQDLDPRDFKLKFQMHETYLFVDDSVSDDSDQENQEPVRVALQIRPKEEEWLEYLCETIPNIPAKRVDLDPAGKEFLRRILKIREDLMPDAPLRRLSTVKQVSHYINEVCATPAREQAMSIQRHFFDHAEILKYCYQLQDMGFLTIDETGVASRVALAKPNNFPEQAIRWEAPESMSAEDEEADDAEGREAWEKMLPPKRLLLTNRELRRKFPPDGDGYGEDRTTDFYRRLGYRLGQTMRILREQHFVDRKLLYQRPAGAEPPLRRDINRDVTFEALNVWKQQQLVDKDDVRNRRRRARREALFSEGKQWTPIHKDVVNLADPEAFKEDPNNIASYSKQHEENAAELMRNGVLRELMDNQSMIWTRKGEADELRYEPGDEYEYWRKEAIWDFGHSLDPPSVNGGQLCNINRWPLHLQTQERQREIKNSGPTIAPSPAKNRLNGAANGTTSRRANGRTNDIEMGEAHQRSEVVRVTSDVAAATTNNLTTSYRDSFLDRYTYENGTELWTGATPRQRKAFVNKLKMRFLEPAKPTLGQRIGWFFGKKRKRDDDPEDERLRLPSPKYMPKIVRRPREPVQEQEVQVVEEPVVSEQELEEEGPQVEIEEEEPEIDFEEEEPQFELWEEESQIESGEEEFQVESEEDQDSDRRSDNGEDHVGPVELNTPPARDSVGRDGRTRNQTPDREARRVQRAPRVVRSTPTASGRRKRAERSWWRRDLGFPGQNVPLELEDMEEVVFNMDGSPGNIETDRIFRQIDTGRAK